MSLYRQLAVMVCCLLSLFFLVQASFLSIQRVLIVEAKDTTLSFQAIPPELPTSIQLPNKPRLPITLTEVQGDSWPLSDKSVQVVQTKNPQDKGFILYGHNWPSLLGGLAKLPLQTEFELYFGESIKETYVIVSHFQTSADNVDVLNLATKNTVLIYTCSGILDTKRFVVLAQKKV